MRKPKLAVLLFSLALGALHCGGDDSSTGGGTAGTGGSSATTGNTTGNTSSTSSTTGSAGSSSTGAGGAGGATGTGGAGGGLLGQCPASQPANGSTCPSSTQLFACPYGTMFCACGQGQPWTCLDLDGGFSFDSGFGRDGFGFGG